MTWADLIGEVDVAHFPYPMKLRLTDYDLTLIVEVRVPERDTRQTIGVFHSFDCGRPPLDEEEGVARIRAWLRQVVLHELDEAFHYKGVRKFDPH